MSAAPRIYTRLGDDGTTGMLFGGRVAKSDALMEAIGAVDEAVASLGVARALAAGWEHEPVLLSLQRGLFVVAADLVCNPRARERLEPGVSMVVPEMIAEMERTIDSVVAAGAPAPVFVVPGADPLSAALDVARTAVRRAERRVLAVAAGGGEVSRDVRLHLNRASDLVYVLARSAAGPGSEQPSHL